MRIDERLQGWHGKGVFCRHDEASDSWIFIAIHDDTLGPPVGGTRIKVYEQPSDGLHDAQRLAEGMTHKWAAIDLAFGGGKAVIALSRPVEGDERVQLLQRYGRLVESLRGVFGTGQDLGTTVDDIQILGRTTRHVHGYDRETDSVLDPGPYTAAGVFAGMSAAAERLFGSPDLAGRSIVFQGVGGVGRPLALLCAAAGASLRIADSDWRRAEEVAAEIGADVVDAERVWDESCDLFAPCAVGAVLNARTIPRLHCRGVAGSANNQLESAEDAERLHRREILYAPDYVINAGGALAFGLRTLGERDETVLQDRVRGLGQTLAELFAEAARTDASPAHAAARRVERTLARGPRP